jgi:uncharacterized membrane protein
MRPRPRYRSRPYSTRRLEAYTDGVFAIAATLLVLDLSVDSIGKVQGANDALWAALGTLYQPFISFVISFLVLCLLWSIHTQQFEFVVRTDGRLVALNSFRLLGVVLIPFTTSLNADYNDDLAGKMLLPANFELVLIVSAIQWYYASGPSGLVEGLGPDAIRATRIYGVISIVIGLAAVAISPWFGSWSFLLFIANPFLQRLFVLPELPEQQVSTADDDGP